MQPDVFNLWYFKPKLIYPLSNRIHWLNNINDIGLQRLWFSKSKFMAETQFLYTLWGPSLVRSFTDTRQSTQFKAVLRIHLIFMRIRIRSRIRTGKKWIRILSTNLEVSTHTRNISRVLPSLSNQNKKQICKGFVHELWSDTKKRVMDR